MAKGSDWKNSAVQLATIAGALYFLYKSQLGQALESKLTKLVTGVTPGVTVQSSKATTTPPPATNYGYNPPTTKTQPPATIPVNSFDAIIQALAGIPSTQVLSGTVIGAVEKETGGIVGWSSAGGYSLLTPAQVAAQSPAD